MYCYVDQPCARLSAGSSFLLAAMRRWVEVAMVDQCPLMRLSGPFRHMAMRPMLDDFHIVMFAIRYADRHRMTFGRTDQPLITDIEAVLLALWSDVDAGLSARTRAVVTLLVEEAAVELVLRAIARVAAHMATLQLAPTGLDGIDAGSSDGAG